MEPQFHTKGIYRPNAQRLSISLAPLVAQRSLLFRVKADLATKTHYSQLTPTTGESRLSEDSPALFAFTASAQIISAALTVASVLSAASVYSQESWKGNHSPFNATSTLKVDTRRHAIAFSPSVQWSDMSEAQYQGEGTQEDQLVEVPLCSAPVVDTVSPKETLEFVSMPLPMDLMIPPTMVVSPPKAVHVDNKADAKQKKKKKVAAEDASNWSSSSTRMSKHSKAFGKVMSRISLQPSKKELSGVTRRQNSMPEFKLSELKPIDTRKSMPLTFTDYRLPEVKTPGPIRMSFIVGRPSPMPEVLTLPQTLAPAPAPAFVPMPSILEPAPAANPIVPTEKDIQRTERARRLHATLMPPTTPSWRQRSLTPPPPISPIPTSAVAAAPLMTWKKGHRRFRSSPAVMNFDFHGWNYEEDVPPLPPMPVILPAGMKMAPAPATPATSRVGDRPRARSQSVVHPPGARRAVATPFPLPRARQASF